MVEGASSLQPAASITNLRLKFPGEEALLFKGFSLSVFRGEKVLLLGPSGCGKSTLLQVLSGLIPRSMEVPMRCDEATIPARAGVVFQDPDTQFCMPYGDEELAFVFENMQIPREDMPGLIRHYLDRVGLRKLVEEPHTSIQSLSQGMKQRLAIASALAMEPDVLFLDEPTALLDHEGTLQVWDTIKQVCADKTLIIVEHKIDEIVDYVDRVIVLSPTGELIADGPPADVFISHKRELQQYGIWYPGVWADYASSHAKPAINNKEDMSTAAPIIDIFEFRGMRGGTSVVDVKRAYAQRGNWIGIVGENGAGKSSLLLAVMRLIKTEGICEVNGRQVKKVEQLAADIAFVFQNPEFQFVTYSVRDEVGYSLLFEKLSDHEREAKTEVMLERFGLLPYAARHPYQLSMGQKRRLSVAAAMVRNQRILLLDEPTFGQDARNTFAMLEQIEQLRQEGTTILMVTHDREIVDRWCTQVWTMKEGELTDATDLFPS